MGYITVYVYVYDPSALDSGHITEGVWNEYDEERDNITDGKEFKHYYLNFLEAITYKEIVFSINLNLLECVSECRSPIDDDLTDVCIVKYNEKLDQWYITIRVLEM